MVFKIIVSLVAFLVIIRLGLFVLRALATPAPAPDEGELRRVNLKYQCSLCGAQVRMTKAGADLPPPPRHCMEDMDLIPTME